MKRIDSDAIKALIHHYELGCEFCKFSEDGITSEGKHIKNCMMHYIRDLPDFFYCTDFKMWTDEK